MFEFTKFTGWLLSPLTIAMGGWVAGIVLHSTRFRRLGVALSIVCAMMLWLVASPWGAQALTSSLERRYPAQTIEQTPVADAILVLGGALDVAHPPERPYADLGSAADRIWHAAALYKAGKAPLVMISGGNQPGQESLTSEAEATRSMLMTLGVPGASIKLEGRSRNTLENARFSSEMIAEARSKQILIVTSAVHMPRAIEIFEMAFKGKGVTFIAATTDVEGVQTLATMQWLPAAGQLAQSSRAIKEYIACIQIRLMEAP
jgi:uncharacterized SAM-binding protein YcdF (DUF218 family)